MNKLQIMLFSLLICAYSKGYASCEGGNFGGNYPDILGKYCISNVKMNWWSAHAWCQSNNMHLVTMEELCPGSSKSSGASCDALKAKSLEVSLWTSSITSTKIKTVQCHWNAASIRDVSPAENSSFAICL